MADTRTLVLRLWNAECELLRDVPAEVRFYRNDSAIGRVRRVRFADGSERFDVPDFPTGVWDCNVRVENYEHSSRTGFLPFRKNSVTERDLWLPRNPKGRWNSQFARWSRLGPGYQPLKDLLKRSSRLRLRIKKTEEFRRLGRLTAGAYDDVDDPALIEGKMGLLNLYAKLMTIRRPCGASRTWFEMLDELLYIQRDRIVAIASREMRDWVHRLKEHSAARAFPDYRQAPAGESHRRNVLASRPGLSVQKIFSVKSTGAIGNLQLTLADVRDGAGREYAVCDADIDENGRLLEHFADWIRHQVTGDSTSPIQVYDILHRTVENPPLGYRLVPG